MVISADLQQGKVTAKMSFMEVTTKVGKLQYAQYLIKQLEPAWGRPTVSKDRDQTVLQWTCVPALASRLKMAVQDLQAPR
jgi:hypothetical protein